MSTNGSRRTVVHDGPERHERQDLDDHGERAGDAAAGRALERLLEVDVVVKDDAVAKNDERRRERKGREERREQVNAQVRDGLVRRRRRDDVEDRRRREDENEGKVLGGEGRASAKCRQWPWKVAETEARRRRYARERGPAGRPRRAGAKAPIRR